ncbi:MAG: right-handed parallel beta-helix repeat-containing protein [candidate division KSB1 bacterium]|nr:right-handed parallel beta-helix repeat-containing protein [candidate division KSB1 bacterium]
MKRIPYLLMCVLLAAMPLWAATYYVATTGSDVTGDGSAGNPWKTITHAISQASAGDVIIVAPGLYPITATITINKTLTILGPQVNVDPRPSAGTSRIAGDASTEAIIDGGGTVSTIFTIAADDVVLNGLEVKSGTGDMIQSSSSAPIKYRTIVKYNIIHNATGDEGMQLRNVTNGVIEYNHIYDIAQDGINLCCGSTGGTIQFNEVHDISSENAAIYVYEATNTTIKGNLVYGVHYNDGIKLGIKGGGDASSTGGSILDNVVHDTRQDAIAVYTSHVTVSGNEVYNSNSENGAIYLAYAIQDITIDGNYIHDNVLSTNKRLTAAGILLENRVNATTVTVHSNCIVNNSPNGVTNEATGTLVATNNWWGAASGPTHSSNPGGTGDVVSDNVSFAPWSTTEQPACMPPPQCGDFALLADTEIELDHYKFVEGDIHSNGDIEFDNGRPSTVTGNVTAIGNIEIERDNTINGDVTANGTVDKDEEATVNGTITSGASLAAVDLPSLSYSCTGTTSVIAGKDKEKNVAPGDYNLLRADKNAQLNLSAGNYSVKTLQLDDRSRLRVDVSGGDVTINVCVQINFIKNADIIITGGTSRNLTINYLGTKKVVLGKDGGYQGSVVAPNALVELGSKAGFLGSICAKSIAIAKDARVRHHDVAGGIPKATADDNEQSTTSDQQPVTSYQLAQNYPNPFNPNTTIRFALPEAGNVTLAIYNIYGQLVRQLVSGEMKAGWHSVVWDAKDDHGVRVASGVYLYVLKAGEFVAQRKLVLMK